ncbi:hypothetical protein MPSEU_000481900 [Mayamaea pseudoterrestris]|nr:hypothetical protein MPSEU_000481900 [Mayamaea pseudoterrestris]
MELLSNRSLAVSRICKGNSIAMSKLVTENLDDEEESLAETASVDSSDCVASCSLPLHDMPEISSLNADSMMCASCRRCQLAMNLERSCCPYSPKKEIFYTRCQVRSHDSELSCWLIAGSDIYDATSLLKTHPGGKECILRKAGGVDDCSLDVYFHSQRGQELWKRYRIGRLIECGQKPSSTSNQWWMFWSKD